MAQVAKELVEIVSLTERRRRRLATQSFHDLEEVRSTFRDWFDIDICAAMKDDERRAVELMFHRRHVVGIQYNIIADNGLADAPGHWPYFRPKTPDCWRV
jgi:hypothetical protein